MNALGIALVWCAIQVTLVAVLAAALYLVVQRAWPGSGGTLLLTTILTTVVLFVLALSPWPRWIGHRSAASEPSESTAAIAPSDATAPNRVAAATREGNPAAPPATESPWAAFREAMAMELARPQPEEATSRWHWPGLVAAGFLAGASLSLLWLLAGIASVRRYRTGSRPVRESDLLELLDVLQAELGCRRQVELRESDSLATAATLGWRRPLVIVSADWKSWSEDQRRAVLAHEIAHICAGDFLTTLCGRAGLVLHFYHPLVHWLLHRLRLEQELAADAVAASVSGGQRAYLATIAELALRQQDRSLLWPARSFLPTRTTFLRRIAMLRDAKLRAGRPSPGLRVATVGIVLLCGIFAAGLRGPAAEQAPTARGEATTTETDQGGIDLKHVPSNAYGFAVLRPAALLANPDLRQLAEAMSTGPSPWRELDLPPSKIRQMTMVFTTLPPSTPQPGAIPLVVVEATEAHDYAGYLAAWTAEPVAQRFLGKTYHAGPFRNAPGSGSSMPRAAYFRPDNRTVVVGMENDVREYLAERKSGLPAFIKAEHWQRYQDAHAAIAIQTALLEGLTELKPTGPQASPIASLAPLWERTESILIGGRWNDRLRLEASFIADTEEDSQIVAETLNAARVLARNMASQLRQRVESSSATPRDAFQVWMLEAIGKFAANLQVERQGLLVLADTAADVEALTGKTLAENIAVARQAAVRAQSANNLKQLGVAMHNFHDTYREFPAAAATSKPAGGPKTQPYSWRVALLPFVDAADLYQQYRFDEPWDSPNNLKLLDKMPAVYRHPLDPKDSTNSGYFAISGPGTLFDGDKPTSIREITDGLSNTLMLVEAKRDVPWTKPEDVRYDPAYARPNLGGYFEGIFSAAFADGAVRTLSLSIDPKVLRHLIEKADGNVVPWDAIEPPRKR